MSARLLREWQLYAEIEPFGPPADCWRTGLTVAMVANVNRTKKTDRSYVPRDFMPRAMVEDEEPDPADMGEQTRRTFEALAEMKTQHGQ